MTTIYLDIEEFKTYASINRALDAGDDNVVMAAVTAATSAINETLQREIAEAGDTPSTRVFEPGCGQVLRIHDCTSVASVTLAGSILNASEYRLEPLNGLAPSGAPRPYEQIRRLAGWSPSSYSLDTVSVSATWGWPEIPGQVYEACKILAKDILSNRDVSFGIAQFTEYAGVRATENPQVAGLLWSLRRSESFGFA